ncbi:uncharacterized protein PAC_19136 [Phialocephala subalpina]|uniref:Uncharacterized protein n=1 Tax=Phialocephala subalpina TaxID=576137 RepID=A0A1L7XW28_9HELO|nr:uncharacterized protein PAC_19136 [Phialocephala subalpina]
MDSDEIHSDPHCLWVLLLPAKHTRGPPICSPVLYFGESRLGAKRTADVEKSKKKPETYWSFLDKWDAFGQTMVNLSTVDPATFSIRLTTAFNTYYYASLSLDIGAGLIISTTNATTTATAYSPFEIVICNRPYFVILLVISLILLVCSLLSVLLRFKIDTPDIMGHISSMAIDHELRVTQSISLNGTHLSALEGQKSSRI